MLDSFETHTHKLNGKADTPAAKGSLDPSNYISSATENDAAFRIRVLIVLFRLYLHFIMTWMKVEKVTKLQMALKNPQAKGQPWWSEDLIKVNNYYKNLI